MARATIRQQTSRRASKAKANKKRRQLVSRWVLGVGGTVAAVVVAAGIWEFSRSEVPGKIGQRMLSARDGLTERTGFRLRQIELTGREKSKRDDLLSAIGIAQGESIFSDTPEAIRARLEKIATVRHATVARVLPDKLAIAIEERKPQAVWQKDGQLHVVDADGVVLDGEKPEKHKNLLVVVGDDAAGKLPELFALLAAEPTVAPQVVAAVRVGERRWDLRLKNNVKIMLPEEDPAAALKQLAQWQVEKKILEKAVAAIDFRLKERTFIRTIPEDKKTGDKSQPSQEI